jgi:hypothetical protein
MNKIVFSIVLTMLFTIVTNAQTNVAIAPVARQQFFDANGKPLASGCVFTYVAGTSTQQATYSDSSGLFQLSNPIILDSGGFATIWLTNNAYRIVVSSAGGINCASGAQQYVADNVSAYQTINQASNIIIFGATSDPIGTVGELGYRTDLPCFRGFTTIWDCFVQNTTPATLINKKIDISANTLTNITNTAGNYPRNNGSTGYVDSAIQAADVNLGTTFIANSGAAGTVLNQTAILESSTGKVDIPGITTTGGVLGICTARCGTLVANSVIQTTGPTSCAFDGSTFTGDYALANFATSPGTCHDAGSSFPAGGQVLGRVTQTGSGAGTYTLYLFGPEVRGINTASSLGSLGSIALTGQTALIALSPLCAATTGACNNAGQYHISWVFYQTGVACVTPGSGGVTFSLTWTDPNSVVHNAVSEPMFNQAIPNAVSGTFGFTNALSTAGAAGGVDIVTNGTAIQYQTGYVACSSGTGTYALDAVVLRLQ